MRPSAFHLRVSILPVDRLMTHTDATFGHAEKRSIFLENVRFE
jgi:hypothetical protein